MAHLLRLRKNIYSKACLHHSRIRQEMGLKRLALEALLRKFMTPCLCSMFMRTYPPQCQGRILREIQQLITLSRIKRLHKKGEKALAFWRFRSPQRSALLTSQLKRRLRGGLALTEESRPIALKGWSGSTASERLIMITEGPILWEGKTGSKLEPTLKEYIRKVHFPQRTRQGLTLFTLNSFI